MKVVVGLSGGVDSSVTAYLLQQQGHEVIGLFMRNWNDASVTLEDECPWIEDSNDALLVAQKLGIPFQVIDMSELYKERIVDYMFAEYEKGRTPNPDVLCNREVKFDVFLKTALSLGIYGLENLALIPGVAGSAPIQNIGAYGVEFANVCDFVDVVHLSTGERSRLSKEACRFGYRDSIFKHEYKDEYAIIAVGLKLPKEWKPVLNYGSLAQFDPKTVTAQQVFEEVCAVRSSKLPNPDEFGNAGSFFKNPVIDPATFQQIQTAYPNIPNYLQADGTVKLAAGWLIDQCSLKGFQVGGAAVHTQQALVLINKENATGMDVVNLAKAVRQQVREKFGVELHPEVRFMGKNSEIDSELITR